MATEREPLTRNRILGAAVALADDGGITKLSMRNLASHLGFEVMSLYNHVANKDDLLRGMVDVVAAEIESVPLDTIENGDDGDDWQGAIRHHAIETKAAFERHPWAVMLWVTTLPGPIRFDHMEWELAALASAGLSEARAHQGFHAITNHVVGYMLQNVSMNYHEDDVDEIASTVLTSLDPTRYPNVVHHIAQHIDGDHGSSFEFVLDLLIAGVADAG